MSLFFYCADAAYCDYLRAADPCVPYTMDRKSTRPFVGILVTVHDMNYYAPLTSPKPKHLSMKNQIDFTKIDGGTLGAINFNNMIPIHKSSLTPVSIVHFPNDTKDDTAYKNLLSNQLSWCNSHRSMLLTKASDLYQSIVSGNARPELKSRCCNFRLDEQMYLQYCLTHQLTLSQTPTTAAYHEQSEDYDLEP